jgi:superoxide oxidase
VTARWPLPIRIIHWSTAGLILVMVPAIYAAMALTEADTNRAEALASLHIVCGFAVLILTLARLAARISFRRPLPALPSLPLRLIAGSITVLIYALLLAMPLTGILKLTLSGLDVSAFGIVLVPSGERVPALARFCNRAHEWLGNGLITLALVHAAAALLHRPLTGIGIMRRMA